MNNKLRTLIEIDKEADNTALVSIHKQRSIDKSICANCEKDVKEINDEEYKTSLYKRNKSNTVVGDAELLRFAQRL